MGDGNNDNFFLIRHGETYANRLDYIQGTLNDHLATLTERGRLEAQRYQCLLKRNQIDYVFTSPLKRAVTTGEIICKDTTIKMQIDDRLAEISYGEWNGTAISKLKQQYASYFDLATNDVRPHSVQVSKGESFAHARQRVWAFMLDISAKYPEQSILIITHGWVIKNIVALCLKNIDGVAFRNPQNLSISKVKIDLQLNQHKICYYNRPLVKIGEL